MLVPWRRVVLHAPFADLGHVVSRDDLELEPVLGGRLLGGGLEEVAAYW